MSDDAMQLRRIATTTLHYDEGTSNKYYRVLDVEGMGAATCHGRVGDTKGKWSWTNNKTPSRIRSEKEAKGYRVIHTGDLLAQVSTRWPADKQLEGIAAAYGENIGYPEIDQAAAPAAPPPPPMPDAVSLEGFAQRALDALTLAATDPQAAAVEYAGLQEDLPTIELAVECARGYLSALEAMLQEAMARG